MLYFLRTNARQDDKNLEISVSQNAGIATISKMTNIIMDESRYPVSVGYTK
jgi:hypothetical protein